MIKPARSRCFWRSHAVDLGIAASSARSELEYRAYNCRSRAILRSIASNRLAPERLDRAAVRLRTCPPIPVRFRAPCSARQQGDITARYIAEIPISFPTCAPTTSSSFVTPAHQMRRPNQRLQARGNVLGCAGDSPLLQRAKRSDFIFSYRFLAGFVQA